MKKSVYLIGIFSRIKRIVNVNNMTIDNSSIEIYIQDGRDVISTRIYQNESCTEVSISSINGYIKIKNLEVYTLGGFKYGE